MQINKELNMIHNYAHEYENRGGERRRGNQRFVVDKQTNGGRATATDINEGAIAEGGLHGARQHWRIT